MRLRNIAARARLPVTWTMSFAVVVAGFLPLDGQVTLAREGLVSRRVVATPVPVAVFVPAEMRIAKIGLTAPVVPVGTYQDGTMGSPTNAVDIGWWSGRRPGQGNALFAAHINWNGRAGSFARLKELQPGDEIVVTGEGKNVTYRIEWVKNFDANVDATDILGNTSGNQVATLITCGGPFDRSIGHHLERVVARAVLSA